MSHQAVSNYGNDCPECHGTGWKLFKHPEYGEVQSFARRCTYCSESRRLSDITGVPSQFSEADLSKFVFDIYNADTSKLKQLIQKYFDKYQTFGKGLYLWSKMPGSGKTFLSCCLGKSIMMRYNLKMRFVTVPEYLSIVGDSYKRPMGELDKSQIYRECDLLLLDDIGSQKSGEWQEQEIFRLIDDRLNNGKITIYTSNQPPESLNMSDRIKSRIKKTLVIQMPEESIRDRKSKAEQDEFLRELIG